MALHRFASRGARHGRHGQKAEWCSQGHSLGGCSLDHRRCTWTSGAFGGPPNEGLTKAHQNVQLAVAKQSKLQSRIALPMIKSQERLGPLGPQP